MDILKHTSDLSTVGGRIKYHRLSKGLLQEDLSQRSGVDRGTIIRYENNQVIHSLDICNKIAEALGIAPSLIYDEYLAFIASDFENKIKAARKSNNLTQEQLGQAVGVHRKTIVRWENGTALPTRENYLLIKDILRGLYVT